MMKFIQKVKALRDGEEGQGLVEYALILVLVSIVAIGALAAIGTNVTNVLQTVANHLNPVG
jgi:pilus assembly protein Flp/PilA